MSVTNDPIHLTDAEFAAHAAYNLAWWERDDNARAALADGRPGDAIMWLYKPSDLLPPGLPVDNLLLCDAALRLGEVDRAYDAMAWALRSGGDDSVMLRASLVAALEGQVYQGQREYLIKFLEPLRLAQYAPDGETPEAIALITLIALANDSDGDHDDANFAFYSNAAFRRDPSNPAVVSCFAYVMAHLGHWQTAAAAIQGAIANAGPDLKYTLDQMLRGYQWQIAHPNAPNPFHMDMRDPWPGLP